MVAEKFHAICLLGLANSRMKDYFDFWILLRENELDPSELKRAIEATFARRKIAMPTATPVGLSDAFAVDASKQAQWRGFLRKNRLDDLALADVVNMLRDGFVRTGAIKASS